MIHGRRWVRLIALLSALLLVLAACGGDEEGGDTTAVPGDTSADTTAETTEPPEDTDTTDGTEAPTGEAASFEEYDLSGINISVGSKDFDEQLVLGYILLHAFEAAGATVEDNINLGGTNLARAALLNGDIDTYMEYNGTGYAVHLANEGEVPNDPDELTEAVREQDLEENDIHWLSRAPFNNTYGFVSSPALTEENGGAFDMQAMADYMEANPDTLLCLESEFPNRDDGLILFEEATGYTVPEDQISILDSGLIYTETANNTCDFGEVFTSDGRIEGLGLTLVEDPGVMILYNVSVNMRDDLYQEAPDVFDAMAEAMLSGLTQETMNGLNTQVSFEGEAPSDVARQYLVDQGLISG
ncbi:MAG TPA: glycine betaine ABC transporter substrate-binding protein [Acidimicrobiia bacterium]|nr:glycine betaine ABC transporter substrate-binding protein [Acidimicrobiia bacterium]